jgi:hypothetical protein
MQIESSTSANNNSRGAPEDSFISTIKTLMVDLSVPAPQFQAITPMAPLGINNNKEAYIE